MGKQNNTVKFGVPGVFSAVPVFRSIPGYSGVPGCSGVPVFRCSGVPVFLILVHAVFVAAEFVNSTSFFNSSSESHVKHVTVKSISK